MFKRFDPSSDVSTSTQVKASVQRSLKAQIIKSNPQITDNQIDELLPKKPPLVQFKVGPHLMIYCKQTMPDGEKDDHVLPENEPWFFQSRSGPVLPTLKLVYSYSATNPTTTEDDDIDNDSVLKFTSVTVDKGAIPFILGGAHIMCPGLTNPGGYMPPDRESSEDGDEGGDGLNKGDGVVIYAQGKELAIAVGVMKLSSSQVRSKNKGVGIEVSHFIGDGLYQTNDLS